MNCKWNACIFRNITVIFSVMFICSCHKVDVKPAQSDSGSNLSALAGNSPNIILIIGDDIGVEVPTYSGGSSYSTPNLDFMAANGIQFTQGYCHPDGFPSRLAIMTGKYNFRNYIYWGYLPPTQKTIGNMLHDAGYATCFAGKWQMSGGDTAIRNAGFDKYMVYLPFGKSMHESQRVGRYKDPILYSNGAYLPDSVTKGQYSADMYVNYMSNFIDSNKTKPFFIVYASNLCGKPYVPTPDDPQYATWDPATDDKHSSKAYYPSMVKYMDKTIGEVIQKVADAGLANNTLIIYTADNGTERTITSVYNGTIVNGGHTTTSYFGTRQSLVAYWPSRIAPAQSTSTLVDFTDFLSTFADVAGIPKPTTYGQLDGVSFYDDLVGQRGTDRNWVFCHWDNNPLDNGQTKLYRWVNNSDYKLYDSTNNSLFFRISTDIYEQSPVPDNQLTAKEKKIKVQFQAVLDSLK